MIVVGLPKNIIVKFLTRCLFTLIAFHIGVANASVALSGLPITQIDILGNKKTQSRFLLKWAKVSVGDLFDQHKLDKARQNILDTGLFKQVTLRTELEQSKLKVIMK